MYKRANLERQLIDAVREENLEKVSLLLQKGADVNSDWLPLAAAVVKGNTDIVKLLIEAGAEVQPHYLTRSIKMRDIDTIKALIESGLDINTKFEDDPYDSFLLQAMSVTDNAEVVRILLNNGADIKHKLKRDFTYLTYALRFNMSVEIVDLLLDAGVNVHAGDDEALLLAVVKGNLDIIKKLLEAGANVNAKNGEILRIANLPGNSEILEEFLEFQNSSLIPAAYSGNSKKVRRMLLEEKSDIHANDDEALRVAARNGHVDVVRILLEAGANIHADDDYALRYAAENGHVDVVQILLEAGANIHARGDFALKWSARNGHVDVVRLLLEAGADGHAGNNFDLVSAAANGHTEVVKLLLEAGADVHADNNFALVSAAAKGHVDVVRLLLEAGADGHAVFKDIKDKEKLNKIVDTLGDPGIRAYKKFLYNKLKDNHKIPKINYSEKYKDTLSSKNNTDLELLKRLKGYLKNV